MKVYDKTHIVLYKGRLYRVRLLKRFEGYTNVVAMRNFFNNQKNWYFRLGEPNMFCTRYGWEMINTQRGHIASKKILKDIKRYNKGIEDEQKHI